AIRSVGLTSSSRAAFAAERLRALAARHLRRRLAEPARGRNARARRDGRELVSFSCNDYLGLATDPRVVDAAIDAARRYGAGAGAARLVTGNHPLFEEDRKSVV